MKKKYYLHFKKLPMQKTPEDIFVTLFGDKEHTFWLDSNKVEKGLSRFSYMGQAKKIITYKVNSEDIDIFSNLEEQLKRIVLQKTSVPFQFVGGFVGYLGYELKAVSGYKTSHTSDVPDSLWYFVDTFLVFDHLEHTMYIVNLSQLEKTPDNKFKKIEKALKNVSSSQTIASRKKQKVSFQLSRNKKQYVKDINECKKQLINGESYEICLTNTITGKIHANSLDIYRLLRRTNPAPYAAYIKNKQFSILCSSPERFLKIDQDGWIESKPIKGTIQRGRNDKEDKQLAEKLRTSIKDQAENLMIVDLVRNDLGKICEVGSVNVPRLMAIEAYQTVYQMVSTIRGKLRKDKSTIDCIKACFPGGSMTGAPKKRTMEILDSLEKKSRGVYSGALGFLSANGAVDLNIVIRTIVMNGKNFSIGAGGAIVSLSYPQSEYKEMLLKAKAPMKAIKIIANAT